MVRFYTRRIAFMISFLILALFSMIVFLIVNSGIIQGAAPSVDERKSSLVSQLRQDNTLQGIFVDRLGRSITQAEQPGQPARLVYEEAYSYLVGYDSAIYGQSGLRQKLHDLLFLDSGNDGKGAVVSLTTDNDLQQFCYDLLQDSEGSVIVMDAKTGALLACTSRSSAEMGFQANLVDQFTDASQNEQSTQRYYDVYSQYPAFFLDRASMAEDPPGSVFKTIVAGALLAHGMGEFTIDDNSGEYCIEGTTFHNFNNVPGGPSVTLQKALNSSSNVYFIRAAVEQLGTEKLYTAANDFLIGQTIETDFCSLTSNYGPETLSATQLASTGFGQGELVISPLHLAACMGGILNDGKTMRPYVIDSVVDDGEALRTAETSVLSQALTEDTAHTLKQMLQNTAASYGLQCDGAVVCAKTGTAETARSLNHLYWMMGIECQDRSYAVVIDRRNTTDTSSALLEQAEQLLQYLAAMP